MLRRVALAAHTKSRTRSSALAGAATVFAAGLLLVAAGFAWAKAPQEQVRAQTVPAAKETKEDVKQAEKAADHGDKAAAEGKVPEALADYARAVQLAPGDITIRRRAAGLK